MKFTRGDTYEFSFQRKDANGNIIMSACDNLWFTVKKNYNTSIKEIQKTLLEKTITFDDKGFYHIVIEPKDTSDLRYGKYVCDIQVLDKGKITTIYNDTLEITKEVTFETE